MRNLTANQKLVLETLKNLISQEGSRPTLSMLQDKLIGKLKISSLNGVVQYLKSLENKGYISREKNKKAGISLLKASGVEFPEASSHIRFFKIPVLGLANCGDPTVFAEQHTLETIKVSSKLIPSSSSTGVFMVKITGTSMNKRGLQDGDYAIIKHKNYCGEIQNGDIVLAVVNGLATIKTLIKTIDTVILRPESTYKKHIPIFLHHEDNFFINGKLIGVFKNS